LFSKQSYKYLLFIHSFTVLVNRLWCSLGGKVQGNKSYVIWCHPPRFQTNLMPPSSGNNSHPGGEEKFFLIRPTLAVTSLFTTHGPQIYLPIWQGITRWHTIVNVAITVNPYKNLLFKSNSMTDRLLIFTQLYCYKYKKLVLKNITMCTACI
jgi:hypothetical protein